MSQITNSENDKFTFRDEIENLKSHFKLTKISCENLFEYLYNYFDNLKIQEFFIDQLYEFPNSIIEFFLPQLW